MSWTVELPILLRVAMDDFAIHSSRSTGRVLEIVAFTFLAAFPACTCVAADDTVPSAPVGESEVEIHSSRDRSTDVTTFLCYVNDGRRLDVPFSTFSESGKPGQVTRVPAGNVVLAVRIQIGGDTNHGGKLNCWNVTLSGGKRYELVSEGIRAGKLVSMVRVWLVDLESRIPVTEKRAIAVVSGEHYDP